MILVKRKIVAIGGGGNGRIKSDGTQSPYETREIDNKIIRLTGKKILTFYLLDMHKLSQVKNKDISIQ